MTALDLAAVCARHGITLTETGGLWSATSRDDLHSAEQYDAAVTAVGKVLQAQYGVYSYQEYKGDRDWTAYCNDAGFRIEVRKPSRFAAVVALADRLATPAPEAGC